MNHEKIGLLGYLFIFAMLFFVNFLWDSTNGFNTIKIQELPIGTNEIRLIPLEELCEWDLENEQHQEILKEQCASLQEEAGF